MLTTGYKFLNLEFPDGERQIIEGETFFDEVDVKDDAGVLTTPSSFTSRLLNPMGEIINNSPVLGTVGHYRTPITVTSEGRWWLETKSVNPNRTTVKYIQVDPNPLD